MKRVILSLIGRGTQVFDLDQFVSDCRAAIKGERAQAHIREIVARAVSDPASVIKTVGEPQRGEMQPLYRGQELTVLNVIWAPWMTLLPHNHRMWAIIGIYTGREDNIFWKPADANGKNIVAAGAKALSARDAEPLGDNIIHSVTNPIPRLTGAIHVYGGDFFAVQRSEWDAETLTEQASDGRKMAQRFEEANAFCAAMKGARAHR